MRGLHGRKRRVPVQRLGGRLEMRPREFTGASGCYIISRGERKRLETSEDLGTQLLDITLLWALTLRRTAQSREAWRNWDDSMLWDGPVWVWRKQRNNEKLRCFDAFHRRTTPSSLYISGNKRKEKSGLYFYTSALFVFLSYTIFSIWCLSTRYIIDVFDKEPGWHQARIDDWNQ